MSRFNSVVLEALPPPTVLEPLDVEVILTNLKTDFIGLWDEERDLNPTLPEFDTILLESEPVTKILETVAYRNLLLRGRINDAAKALLLATSFGSNLDHLAASYYGISRLKDDTDPLEPIFESDDRFKRRIILSVEAWSTAGPEGAYIFHALESSLAVLDVAVYSGDDNVEHVTGEKVKSPEILIIVLGHENNGEVSINTLDTVKRGVSAEGVRPIGDQVFVHSAEILEYTIEATLKYALGSDIDLIKDVALNNVRRYVDKRRQVGMSIQLLGLGAALKVTDVEEITLTSPTSDIIPQAREAAFCVTINITVEQVVGTW